MPTQLTPAQAWQKLKDGNERFVSGNVKHPSQSADRRKELQITQNPFATIFGCSDSRVAAEIIFDRGLGDLFVVRTAGHTVDTTVIGTLEYAVHLLDTPLIIVLGHDKCGAIHAAAQTLASGEQPSGFIRALTDRVIPSIVGFTKQDGALDQFTENQLRTEHVKHTGEMLHGYSAAIAAAVAEGRLAIVGLEYDLEDGKAHLVNVIGDIGEVA